MMTERALSASAQAQAHNLEHAKALSEAMLGFVTHRLEEDRTSARLMSACCLPDEMASVWGKFMATAIGDYARHSTRMAELWSRIMFETVQDAERQGRALSGPSAA
jgi:hypothetical protein